MLIFGSSVIALKDAWILSLAPDVSWGPWCSVKSGSWRILHVYHDTQAGRRYEPCVSCLTFNKIKEINCIKHNQKPWWEGPKPGQSRCSYQPQSGQSRCSYQPQSGQSRRSSQSWSGQSRRSYQPWSSQSRGSSSYKSGKQWCSYRSPTRPPGKSTTKVVK